MALFPLIKQVRYYDLNIASASTSNTLTVTNSENLAYSKIELLGHLAGQGPGTGGGGYTPGYAECAVTNVNTGTGVITVARGSSDAGGSAPVGVKIKVTEYYPFVLRQPVTRFSKSLGSSASPQAVNYGITVAGNNRYEINHQGMTIASAYDVLGTFYFNLYWEPLSTTQANVLFNQNGTYTRVVYGEVLDFV